MACDLKGKTTHNLSKNNKNNNNNNNNNNKLKEVILSKA
jgi:hypothetical protein